MKKSKTVLFLVYIFFIYFSLGEALTQNLKASPSSSSSIPGITRSIDSSSASSSLIPIPIPSQVNSIAQAVLVSLFLRLFLLDNFVEKEAQSSRVLLGFVRISLKSKTIVTDLYMFRLGKFDKNLGVSVGQESFRHDNIYMCDCSDC